MSESSIDIFAGAVRHAADIRAGKVTSRALLDAYLDRVERFNPDLNAIVYCDRDAARARADELDLMASRNEWTGPLHGVPMTVKESYDLIGSPTTWGLPEMRENFPERNALSIDRLLNAGAVIFGKTNVPLLLSDWQSFNDIYGVTNNPWDKSLSPGGSSGGSAAALAAGLCALEAGSDIGASIRNPAHYCGVFGHKPSYGICPPRGQALPGVIAPSDISVIGPMARTAEDLATALDAMAGPDTANAVGWRLKLPKPRKTRLQDFKIGVKLTDQNSATDREMTDVLQSRIDEIAAAGAAVSDRAAPEIDTLRSHELYLALLRSATSSRLDARQIAELEKQKADLKPSDTSYLARTIRANTMHHAEWLHLNNERAHLREQWAKYFQEYDFLLCPAAASAAQPHDHEGERHDRSITVNGMSVPTTDQLFWAGYCGVVYLPATVAPAGLTRSGLPAGIQIIGPYLEDHGCIAFAKLLEDRFGGFTAPPGYGV